MKWLDIARSHLGMKEIEGPHHNPQIVGLWKTAHVAGVGTDEVPWCAAFVSAVLELAGIVSARTGWARAYLQWGQPLSAPAVGAIVVFERGPNAGHVGFVVGRDAVGHLIVLGGNQGDMVRVSPFAPGRVLGYRWPPGQALPPAGPLPIVRADGPLSRDEA